MEIKEYDVVALTENIHAIHQETKAPILLHRGQVGTVLMKLEAEAALVDFADAEGRTDAMKTIAVGQLMPLVYEPTMA